MALAYAHPTVAPPDEPRRLPLVRWAGLLVLLLGELVALTLWVDTGAIADERGWWAALVGESHQIATLVIAVAAAAVLLGGRHLGRELARLSVGLGRPHRALPWLLGHLIAFAAFGRLSSLVTGGVLHDSAYPAAWGIAWVATALMTLVCWCAAAVRPGLWLVLARPLAGVFVSAVAVGGAAWGASRLSSALWTPLGQSTFRVVRMLLGLISTGVVCRPESMELGIGNFVATISPQCSGYEGIGLIWVFLAAYLWIFRAELRFPHVLLVIPLGTAVIWLANAARIAGLILVGAWYSPALAVGGFHSLAGWLAFNGVALGIVVLTRRLPCLAAAGSIAAMGEPKAKAPEVAYLVPLLVLVGATMIGSAFSSGFDASYPLRVLATAAALWAVRGGFPERMWAVSWQALSIGVAAFVLWMAMEPSTSVSPGGAALTAGLARLPRAWAAAWLAFRVVGSVITVPLAEELAFRGFLPRRLIAADFTEVPLGRFTWVSFALSSVLFGALHGRWLAGTLAGALYALALTRRRRLADAVVAHATTNALIATYVLATGSWALWT